MSGPLLITALLIVIVMVGSKVFVDAVRATQATDRFQAPPTLLPGFSYNAQLGSSGALEFGFEISTWWILLPLAVFLIVSRSWRVRSRARAGQLR